MQILITLKALHYQHWWCTLPLYTKHPTNAISSDLSRQWRQTHSHSQLEIHYFPTHKRPPNDPLIVCLWLTSFTDRTPASSGLITPRRYIYKYAQSDNIAHNISHHHFAASVVNSHSTKWNCMERERVKSGQAIIWIWKYQKWLSAIGIL